MLSYIELLKNHSEYEITKNTLFLPNVTLCEDNLHVHYMPVISINNAIVTCDPATYDGTSHLAANIQVIVNGVTLVQGIDYEVVDNEGWDNAGIHTFTVRGLNLNYKGEVTGSFVINKASGEVTTPPTANNLTYNTQEQALVVAGSGTGAIRYCLDGGEWSENIPTATNAGEYVVGYKALESSNYEESQAGSILVTINKLVPTVTPPTSKSITYDGDPHDLINLGSTSHGTIEYSLDENTWIQVSPTATNAGTYTVYYHVVGDSNISDVPSASINVTINKATGEVTTDSTANTLTYNATDQALITACSGTGTAMYKLGTGEWSSTIPVATNAGEYTVYFKVAESSNYLESSSDSVTVTINKVTPTVTSPAPNVLTFNKEAQELVTAGSADYGTMQYSIDGTTWSTSVPTATRGGTYTIYYKVVGDSNINDVASDNVLGMIAEKRVSNPTIVLDVTSYDYDGDAHTPTPTVSDGEDVINPVEYTVEYLNNTNAGTATVVISDNTAGDYYIEGTQTFTINKIAPVYTAPTGKSLSYTGSAQDVVNVGSSSDGTFHYSYDDSTWDTVVPSQTNAGTYTIYWKLVGDINHTDVASSSVSTTIDKVAPTYTAPTAKSLTYNGSAQYLVNAGSTSDGTIQYSTDNSTWDTAVPTGTNAGSYTTYWRVIGDGNHTDESSSSIATTISKATGSVSTAPTNRNVTWNGNNQNLVNAGSGTGTIYYNLNGGTYSTSIPVASAVGSYTVYYYVAESSNYTQSSTGSVTATINKAGGYVTTAPTNRGVTYNGGNQNLVNAGAGTGTMYYSLNGGAYSASIPLASAVGSYTVYYYTAESTNYTQSGVGSLTATIGQAGGYVSVAPSNRGVTYNGSYLNLVNAGSGTGTMYYSLNGGGYSASIPQAVGAGSYTIYYYVAASTNYTLSGVGSMTATIGKAGQSAPTAYGATTSYPTAATASASGGGGVGSLVWESAQSQTSVGSHSTRCYWAGNENYYGSGWSNYATVTMNKANQSAPTAYGSTVNYGSTAVASASGGGGAGSIEWSNGNTRTAIGSQTTYARWTGDGNYNASGWSNAATLTVNIPTAQFGNLIWSKFNVGATSEDGYGTQYTWDNLSSANTYGGSWRVPTEDDWRSLLNSTGYTYLYNPLRLKLFNGNTGEYLIFPANANAGSKIICWSSTEYDNYSGCCIYVSSGDTPIVEYMDKRYDASVRLVRNA